MTILDKILQEKRREVVALLAEQDVRSGARPSRPSLFEKLYDQGLVDPSFNADFVSEVDYGHSIISGQSTDPKSVKEFIDDYIKELKASGIQKDDFERIKRKQIGDNLSFFNSIEYTGNSFVSYYFKDINYLEYIEVLKEVTLEEVQLYLMKHFDETKQVLSIIKP